VADPSGATVRLLADVRDGTAPSPGSRVKVIAPDEHLISLPR
jgi:putative spermidine/putrescine transport system ATP-binding protein